MALRTTKLALGVTGSIAAYKAAYLTRLLVEAGTEVWPILTPAASRFVGALTFSTLAGRRAIVDLWSAAEAGEVGHVELAHRIDLLVVAPATADFLARLVHGRADDPLSAVALATRAPLLVAPAMETGMWSHAATQDNVARLRERGVHFVEPDEGFLASGRQGKGRMAEPETIVAAIAALCTPHDLEGRRLVITAGPTREAFDPARFISNPSTGKMGLAIAEAARQRGAQVTLICGPTHLPAPAGVRTLHVQTTAEMLTACEEALPGADALIMAAAPADYRPAHFSRNKLKKESGDGTAPKGRTVELAPTPDILRTLQARQRGCYTIGFAAETDDLRRHAQGKLEGKDLDLIVVNDITRPDAGFGSDTNAVTLIGRDGTIEELPLQSKHAVAAHLLDRLRDALTGKES